MSDGDEDNERAGDDQSQQVTWTPKRGPVFYAVVWFVLVLIGLGVVGAISAYLSRVSSAP